MEKITIKNFAGIDNLEIELNRFNVFIGKQATGKSVTAKLIYFFKGILQTNLNEIYAGKKQPDIENTLITRFTTYFPVNSWPVKKFEITYQYDDHLINLKGEKNLTIAYSDSIVKLLDRYRNILKAEAKHTFANRTSPAEIKAASLDKLRASAKSAYLESTMTYPVFMPAGRSFFANLQNNIFTFLSSGNAIDPFLLEFGSFYENIKRLEDQKILTIGGKGDKRVEKLCNDLIYSILSSKYIRENEEDFLLHTDNRKVNLALASSGQQEILPLLLMLRMFIINRMGIGASGFFIEEPETHLYPSAQRTVVEIMALAFNKSATPLQLIITTHSTYVVTVINNLILARRTLDTIAPEKKARIVKIVKEDLMLYYNDIAAFEFKDGTAVSLMDDEAKIIHTKHLDDVSEDIMVQYDDLLYINHELYRQSKR